MDWLGAGKSALRALSRASVNFVRDQCFDRSTVIAYFGLLSFLPLAVFLVALGALALGTDAAERTTEAFLQNLFYTLPPSLMNQVRALQEQVWSGIGYLFLVLWTATKVLSKMEAALDHVFRIEKRRPFAVRKLFGFALVALMSVILVGTVLMESLLTAADRFIDTTALAPLKNYPLYHQLDGIVSRDVLPWVLTVLGFFMVYWLIPATRVPVRVALTAALVAGSLWTGLKLGFAYYIVHLANYTRTYGALATIIVVLLWFNVSAALLLWGGELAAVTGGFREADE